MGLVVGSKLTGNAIFDLNKKISVRERQTGNFDLEGSRYSLTVTKISGNTASFTLKNRDTGKSVEYPNQQQSEGLPIWQRYDLYISSIAGKTVTFVITEKSISAGNSYTKDEINAFNQEIDDTFTRIYAMIDQRPALTNCTQVEPDSSQNRWCSATCQLQGKKTIASFTYISYVALKTDGQRDLHQVPLFVWGDNQPMPSCGDGTTIGCGLAGDAEELMELETGFNATTTTISNVGVYSKCICC